MDEEEQRPSKRRSSRSRATGAQPIGDQPPARTRSTRQRTKAAPKMQVAVSTVQVQIAVEDAYLHDFGSIVKRGRELGLEVEQELPEVGVIIGRMPADKVEDMGACEGVLAVERPRSYRIGPPEDTVQ